MRFRRKTYQLRIRLKLLLCYFHSTFNVLKYKIRSEERREVGGGRWEVGGGWVVGGEREVQGDR